MKYPAGKREFREPSSALLGLGGWVVYVQMLRPAPGLDWMVYYTASRIYLLGDMSALLDPHRFTLTLDTVFSGWLEDPLRLHPWVYPPHFLLLFLPFGLLPPLASYAAFMIVTFLGLLVAIRRWLGGEAGFWTYAASLALSPATALAVCVGQNAFLATALLVGGFALLETGPVLAGFLLGLSSFKPQLFLMVPVALFAGRRWTTRVSAGATCLAVCLISAVVFGVESWRGWFELMLGHGDDYAEWRLEGRLWGMSVYACAVELGASYGLAQIVQLAAALIAAGGVVLAFRQPMSNDLRLAALLSGTFLAAPHVSNYDAVMLTIAATVVFQRSTGRTRRPTGLIVATLIWICPIANPPILHPIGALTPALTCAFLGFLMTMSIGYQRDLVRSDKCGDQSVVPPCSRLTTG